jgi:hypothetical protein
MFLTDRSLMRAQQPAFDQGGNAMNPGHADVGRIASVRDNNPFVFVAALRQVIVAAPPIGQNLRTFLGNVADERHKAFAGDIRYPAHRHASKPLWRMDFECNDHDLLTFRCQVPVCRPYRCRQYRFHPLQCDRRGGPVRDGPWLASAYATMSKPSDNSRSQERASDRAHSPHPSGWSQTTWRQIRFSTAFACDRKWFLPLPTPHLRTADNGDILDLLSMAQPSPRSERIEIPEAKRQRTT